MGEGSWEKASVMGHLKNAFGGISDCVESSEIIWNNLDSVHLEASEIIWGHLRSCGIICVHLGLPEIVWFHPRSSGIISRIIWNPLGEPTERRHLKKGYLEGFGKDTRSFCNRLQKFW